MRGSKEERGLKTSIQCAAALQLESVSGWPAAAVTELLLLLSPPRAVPSCHWGGGHHRPGHCCQPCILLAAPTAAGGAPFLWRTPCQLGGADCHAAQPLPCLLGLLLQCIQLSGLVLQLLAHCLQRGEGQSAVVWAVAMRRSPWAASCCHCRPPG